jgi:hypothetical protein
VALAARPARDRRHVVAQASGLPSRRHPADPKQRQSPDKFARASPPTSP